MRARVQKYVPPSMAMQKNKLPKDLLLEWAREHDASLKRKRAAVSFAVAGLIVAGFAELAVFRTLYVLGATCVATVLLVALAVGIGYSSFVFYVAWSYGSWVRTRGQSKPSPLQVLTILFLATAAALPIASLTLHDEVNAAFWLCLGFMVWNNASAAVMGYLARFLLDSR